MRKILLYIVLCVSFLGNVNGQLSAFYPPSQELAQSDLGIVPLSSPFSNIYKFDATAFLSNWNPLNSPVEFTYLWSFGDGRYSTDAKPTHSYPVGTSANQFQVVLYATPIYIPLGPPPAFYLKATDLITIPGEPNPPSSQQPSFMDDANIMLSYNRLPRASHELTFILSYRNASGSAISSPFPIHLDYNKAHFNYKGIVAPGGETFVSDEENLAEPVGSNFPHRLTFMSSGTMMPDEERAIFIQMKATEEVIGDMEINGQNQVLIESVPELFAKAESNLGTGTLHVDAHSMYAVGSWDPNNKISSVQYLNRDDISFPQKIRYRINCENVGTSSTSTVSIKDFVSPILKFSSYDIVGQKNPTLAYDADANESLGTITINFPNLSLEGMNSDNNVNPDDCRYWVDIEYDVDPIHFDENFGSLFSCASTSSLGSFGTHADIVFDNHPTVISTNVASTEVFCEVPLKPFEIVRVFPNPVIDFVDITYVISPSTEPIDLKSAKSFLVDVNTGIRQQILNLHFDEKEGMHQVQLDLSNVNRGSYIFQIHTSGLTFESSIIVKQ